jgi:predicted nucleic acid-binding Zn ribbon protein
VNGWKRLLGGLKKQGGDVRYKNNECVVCGGSKREKRGNTYASYVTCSDECAKVRREAAHASYRQGKNSVCQVCGKEFWCSPSQAGRKTCSRECSNLLPKSIVTKTCLWCKKEFPGRRKYCSNECQAMAHAERSEKLRQPGKSPGRVKYARSTKNFYTRKDKKQVIDTLTAKQGGKCAICGCKGYQLGNGKIGLVLDHDHETGEARAMLCGKCNAGLGMFGESPERLRRAHEYAQKWATKPLLG